MSDRSDEGGALRESLLLYLTGSPDDAVRLAAGKVFAWDGPVGRRTWLQDLIVEGGWMLIADEEGGPDAVLERVTHLRGSAGWPEHFCRALASASGSLQGMTEAVLKCMADVDPNMADALAREPGTVKQAIKSWVFCSGWRESLLAVMDLAGVRRVSWSALQKAREHTRRPARGAPGRTRLPE